MAPISWPHGNSVLVLRPLANVLGRLGLDSERFLVDVGVTSDAPVDSFVPSARVDRALEAIAASRGDETFALTLAREAVTRPPVGLFAHVLWLGATVGGAFAQAVRMYPLVTQRASLALEVAPGSNVATLTQRMFEGARRGRILTEYMFATLVLRARAAAGTAFGIRSMRFADSARSTHPYEEIFGAPVAFDGTARADTLTLDAEVLALPLSTADPFTAAALDAQLAQLNTGSAPLLKRVHVAVRAELREGRPSLASIARRLGVDGRTLRRQLEAEHLSLRALVTSAQKAYAMRRLASGAHVKDVAVELGFSEPSAFSRAYKRWTGSAPSAQAGRH